MSLYPIASCIVEVGDYKRNRVLKYELSGSGHFCDIPYIISRSYDINDVIKVVLAPNPMRAAEEVFRIPEALAILQRRGQIAIYAGDGTEYILAFKGEEPIE